MRITKLQLKNYRCYRNFTLEFEDDLTVIVAENGKGKSAILDALVVAVGPYLGCFNGTKTYNFEDNDVMQVQEDKNGDKLRILRMQRQYPVLLEAEGYLDGEKAVWRRELLRQGGRTTIKHAKPLTDYGRRLQKAIHEKADENIVLPVIAFYGTTRMWEDGKLLAGKMKKINMERDSGYYEAIEPASTYQTFGHWFQYAALSAMEFDCYIREKDSRQKNPYREVLKAVSRAIGTCVSSMGWKDIDYSVALQSLVITNDKVGTLPVSALSDGIRSVISMVADIAYRMARLNPDLGAEAALKTVVADLRRAFPLVQFIITTHSPQVLSTVPPRCIRALRWDDGQVEVYSPEFSLGAESYQLLKEIQNVDTRPQALPIVKTLMRYLELVSEDKWDSLEAIKLREELDKWGKDREPALLRADLDIKMRAYRRKKQ